MNEDYIYAKISEEEDDEEEGPVLSLHETILLLDRLVKGGNGIDCEYVSSEMEKAYPLLRQAALDGERYRKAGEALMKTKMSLEGDTGWCAAGHEVSKLEDMGCRYCLHYVEHKNACSQFEQMWDSALTAYRQAVEQKEV